MKQIREAYKKTGRLHHAHGLLGDREFIKKELLDFLKADLGFTAEKNPDCYMRDFNVFKVADSRALNLAQLNKSVTKERKIFILSVNNITKDAQNSLLKIFEEPSAETVFFLLMPVGIDLLPTFLSRLLVIKMGDEEKSSQAKVFLKSSTGERLEMITKMMKELKDEKITKTHLVSFIKDLEREVAVDKKNLSVIYDLEQAISYGNDESPSMRVILEHLAVTLWAEMVRAII